MDTGWRRNKKTGGLFNINEIKNKGPTTINEYMNNFIRINAKKEDIEKNTKIETIDQGTFEEEKTTWKTKYAIDKTTGQTVGELNYKIVNGEYRVTMIIVYEEFRKRGYATMLMKDLQKEVGNKDIDFDLLTDDGKALIDKIGIITNERTGGWGVKHYKGRIKL